MIPKYIPIVVAACFLLVVVVLNTVFVCFPTDNDLDEVGWLADHVTLERPESLSNANYPLGLPVLLRVLTPVFGSLLVAALVCSAVACTIVVLLAYRLAMLIDTNRTAAFATLLLVSLIVFKSATSEFADSISAAMLFGSLCVFLSGIDRWKNHLIAGLIIGVAFVFRYHYQVLAIVIPVAAIAFGGTKKQNIQRIAVFVAGFLLGAIPVLLANMAAHGSLLHSGITPYLVGQHATKSVDWENYLGTYDLWPVWKLVFENPLLLAKHMISNLVTVVGRPIGFAALLLAPAYLQRPGKSTAERIPLFIAIFVVVYLVGVIAPTQVTERAMVPVEALMAVLVVRGGATLLASAHVGQTRVRWLAAWFYSAVLLLLVGGVPGNVAHIQYKLGEQRTNQAILEKLRAAGMTDSREVFSTHWNIYPLDDPKFVTFYNYGGWLLLDSEYVRQRPAPTATTPDQWRDFMREQGLRFLVLHETEKTKSLLSGELPSDEWQVIGQDSEYTILSLLPDSS